MSGLDIILIAVILINAGLAVGNRNYHSLMGWTIALLGWGCLMGVQSGVIA